MVKVMVAKVTTKRKAKAKSKVKPEDKNDVGRPSKYTDKTLEIARDYIDNFEPDIREAIPMIAGLAKRLGVHRSTVYDWSGQSDKEEFSDIVERILLEQEMMLLSGGLMNVYNATLAKLGLAKHGYTDKAEIKDTTQKSIDDLSDEELDAYILERTHKS